MTCFPGSEPSRGSAVAAGRGVGNAVELRVGRTATMSDFDASTIAEALEVLATNGVEADAWTVLSSSNRLVLELRPCGLIAKVVQVERYEELAREVAVAKHVVACKGPAAAPAASSHGPYRGSRLAVSVWHPVAVLGELSEPDAWGAYLELRRCLDSFAGDLPDFRQAIAGARGLVEESELRGLGDGDAAFLRGIFDSNLSALSAFPRSHRVLHGDPHAANVVLTAEGPRWLEFESACAGPLEWDLSALQSCAPNVPHDSGLLRVLVSLRRACVVAWCSAKRNPTGPELDAIAYHLDALKAEV